MAGAAGDPGDWRAHFKEAAGELNYGRRCAAFSRLGERLASEVPQQQLADGLSGLASDTFSALGALAVAQKAGCTAVAKALLSHPSQAVRSRAATLLPAADAEEAFLSEDSNQQLKSWLVRCCPALPCSSPVLEHAHRMFSPDIVWLVLQRTQDEGVFAEWTERLSALWPASSLPGMARLAEVFPDSILGLVRRERFRRPSWEWLLLLAQRRPRELLELALWEKGGTCLRDHLPKLIAWSWRHQHDIMMKLCLTKLSQGGGGAPRLGGGGEAKPRLSAHDLVKMQQSIVSSHACPTVIRKIDTIVAVFSGLPEKQKTLDTAKQYIELLPSGIEPRRSKELERLVGAYWQVMDELGRGKLEQATNDGLFAALAERLPPPLAVEQLFRVLRDVEPADKVYLFVQSDLCRSEDGRHDGLMQRVFERFLQSQREGRTEASFVKAFQALLQTAHSMDVVQRSFEALTARLRGATERSLFRDVVRRMKDLDASVTLGKEAPGRYPALPAPSLPLPASWLGFVPYPEKAPPHVAFLHGALASWAADADALNQAVGRFGTALFWSTLEHVLEHALGKAGTPSVQWARAEVNFEALAHLSAIAPVPRSTSTAQASGAAAAPEQAGLGSSVYFAQLEAKKQDTFHRDANTRVAGYTRLLNEARKEANPGAALDDLVPFLATRFGGEQENVQFQVLNELLPNFSAELWAKQLEPLQALWKVYSKARGQGATRVWNSLGQQLVRHELAEWKSGQAEPSAVCTFGLEVAQGILDFGGLFEQLHSSKGKDMREEAARWLLQAFVPLPAQSAALLAGEAAARCALKDFCGFFQRMATIAAPAPGVAERTLWERWQWVGEWWEALLGRGVSLSGAEFLLAGVIEHWAGRQHAVALPADGQGRSELWWRPLEGDAYRAAVGRLLLQIETGEIPCVDGAKMIALRSGKVQIMEDMLSTGSPSPKELRTYTGTAHDGSPWYSWPQPNINRTHPDKSLVKELGVLSKLLDRPDCPRQVQWSAVVAVAGLTGSAADGLLRQVINGLDARKEGMARCVAQQYPYLNAALAAEESSEGSCDLLTAAVELWLHSVDTRDARVEELMGRADAECLLFFGDTFAEHLSRCRQEWLHQCLLKLKAPPQDPDSVEFYHHTARIPSLARVAQFSKGWRASDGEPHNPAKTDSHSHIMTFFWHPSTQTEFLKKGLTSTDMSTLAIIPSLEYVDGVGRAGELLEEHPREQEGTVQTSGWSIIQATGSVQDVWAEVEKRFTELGTPVAKNSIGDREADQLLVNLGRADHADNALKILGRYASKFKRAKEALVLAVPNLSPSHARRVIEEVCLGQDAGVSLQVAALRLIMDLQVPRPLQLYRVAWRGGVCHRDVAASILTKVATSPVSDWAPEDVRDMFDIFSPSAAPAATASNVEEGIPVPAGKKYPGSTYQAMSAARSENLSYIAMILLDALVQMPKWSLPFLPEVVARMAMLPDCTDRAVSALYANQGQTTEVIRALTEVMGQARLADTMTSGALKRTSPGSEPLSKLLSSLSVYAPGNRKSLSNQVKAMNLAACELPILRAFVGELLSHSCSSAPEEAKDDKQGAKSSDVLADAMSVWTQALRKDAAEGSWEGTLLEMEQEVLAHGSPAKLGMLAGKVFERVEKMRLARKYDGPWALPVLKRFVERILQHLEPSAGGAAGAADARSLVVLTYWARLVAQGGSREDVEDLLRHCPNEQEVTLASNVVAHVQTGLWWDDMQEKAANVAAAEAAARRVLAWLAESGADGSLAALAGLWPRVLASDADGSALEEALATFGRQPLSGQGVVFVENLLRCPTTRRGLALRALRWLAESRPRDAVRLWPSLLDRDKGQSTSESAEQMRADVAELLSLCEAKGLEPPELLAGRTKPVVALLAASPLPKARLSAVSALQERDLRDKDKDQADLLRGLQADPCVVVSVAARLAWTSVFGSEEEAPKK